MVFPSTASPRLDVWHSSQPAGTETQVTEQHPRRSRTCELRWLLRNSTLRYVIVGCSHWLACWVPGFTLAPKWDGLLLWNCGSEWTPGAWGPTVKSNKAFKCCQSSRQHLLLLSGIKMTLVDVCSFSACLPASGSKQCDTFPLHIHRLLIKASSIPSNSFHSHSRDQGSVLHQTGHNLTLITWNNMLCTQEGCRALLPKRTDLRSRFYLKLGKEFIYSNKHFLSCFLFVSWLRAERSVAEPWIWWLKLGSDYRRADLTPIHPSRVPEEKSALGPRWVQILGPDYLVNEWFTDHPMRETSADGAARQR